MNKSDFDYDPDGFQRELGVVAHAYKQATARIMELVPHWQELGRDLFGGKITVEAVAESNEIDVSVTGKSFKLKFEPLMIAGSGYANVYLSIKKAVSEERTVISRFLVAPGGSFLSAEGEELLSKQDWHYGFKSLVILCRKALQTPADPA